jgi:hypothetical protein
VEIKNTIIKILNLIIKHLCGRVLVFEEIVDFIHDLATSKFLYIDHESKYVFSKHSLLIPFRMFF